MQFKVKGIISYPNLFQARSIQPGDDPKYSCSVLLKKGDPQIAAVQTIIEQEKANAWPSGFPPNGKLFMKDCSVAFPSEPSIHGYMVVSGNARVDSKPAVVDMNTLPVIDPSLVYAGAVAWVAFNSFTYDQPVNKGVSAGLNAVMITGEMGELGRLDGRPSVESMFADVTGSGTAPTSAISPSGGVVSAPNAPPAPAPAAPKPANVMTAKATFTYEQYIEAGHTNETLINEGLMIKPSFA